MSKIKLLRGEFDSRLKLQLAPGIKAGFPSPAEDYLHDSLDFNRDLIKNPEATFYARISGDSMVEAASAMETLRDRPFAAGETGM